MLRLFADHERRLVQDLCGIWDFALTPDRQTVPDEFPERMPVPGCYDAMPAHLDYRGPAAYRTWFETDARRHRLVFEGVSHIARVLVDGQPVAWHSGAFTSFHVDLPAGIPGRHELVVLVDNSFDAEASPLHYSYFDWYTYGGIIRPVALHRLPPVWIEQMTVQTQDWRAGGLNLHIAWSREADAPTEVEVVVLVDGEIVVKEPLACPEVAGSLEIPAIVPDPKPWSPAEPNLHTVQVRLGEDDLIERIGLRDVRVEGTQILLNDEPIYLAGVNRHEAHPQFGHSLPPELMLADIQWLKKLNCNFVRGSHYPQDFRFLDLCDEQGLLVWQEATSWQARPDHLSDPAFVAAQLQCIDEMVAQSINHPSVIMWGILNEAASDDPTTRPAYERLLGRLRELDPSRPVTYASHRHLTDQHFDLADIISLNIYPGWYFANLETMTGWMDNLMQGLKERGWGKKPLIFSEFGAGAIYGWHDARNGKWSEPYQAKLLDIALNWMIAQPQVAGTAIWQFCDCLSSPERATGRPREFNNKGLLDEYRRPKLAFDVVREIYARAIKR